MCAYGESVTQQHVVHPGELFYVQIFIAIVFFLAEDLLAGVHGLVPLVKEVLE